MNEEPKIDMTMIIAEWNTAKQNTDHYTNDFVSLDNIVDGVPIQHQAGAPYVGDTTLAGLVRSIPRSSLQQLPIFSASVNGTKNSINAQIATFLLRDCIFNEDTFGKGLLSTMQMGGEQALTHGYAPFMCAVGKMFDDFGTTMRLLHYADCAPEPGIQDANESGYFYVRANLTKSRLIKIRDAALENENTSWNTDALTRLAEMMPVAPNYSIYQSDPSHKAQAALTANTYEIITRKEVGKNAKDITFCPQIEDSELRVVKSKSKFGYPRVQFLVIDPAPLTPFGLSRVRLASPNQNLMNAYYQNVASMFILNSKPPVLQRGRFTSPVQLKQGAKWVTLDQNATVELKEMSNGTLQQFVPMAQQMAAQIQNIMGAPQGTTNGNTNSLGFSKTAPGVKMQQQFLDTSTNQITNIMENFLRQYGLVALDIYLSEKISDGEPNPASPNEEELIVDDECKNAINRIGEHTFVPSIEQPEYIPLIGDDNKITVNWDDFYGSIEKWKIEVELSIGKNELDEKQRADLQDMLTVLLQNSDKLGPDAQTRISELLDMLMEKSVPQSKRLMPPSTAQTPIIGQPTPELPAVAQPAVQ